MRERIRTLHPNPDKQGVNIDKGRYDIVADTILETIEEEGVISFKELTTIVGQKIQENFDGSIGWYTTTIKLDLEARGMIQRIPGSRPQLVCLVNVEEGDK